MSNYLASKSIVIQYLLEAGQDPLFAMERVIRQLNAPAKADLHLELVPKGEKSIMTNNYEI